MSRSIVVGLDERGHSGDALKEAVMLGETLGLPVHAFHVVDPDYYVSVLGAMDAREYLLPKLEAEVKAWTSQALPEGAAKPDVKVLLGNPVRALVRQARDQEAALLVVGGHARARIIGRFLGGTAERLVRASDCPVLVRRRSVAGEGGVLVPVDLSDESRKALEWGAKLAAQRGVPLYALHVYVPMDVPWADMPGIEIAMTDYRTATLDTYRDFVKEVLGDTACTVLIQDGRAQAKIKSVAEANAVDLVVMGSHGRTGLARWALGSVTEHVLRSTDLSVLVVKEGDREFLL